jgi:uncharacterized protein (TIGR02444 family)
MAEMPPSREPFWEFSLAFYALPEVAAALVALQDRAGLDVNLILYALWHGLSGRGRLAAADMAAAERAVRPLRVEIIGPLRALRRRLKPDPDPAVQRLRDEVKRLELAAERIAQARLAALAGPAPAAAPPPAGGEAARANLALCLGPRAGSAEAAALLAALDRLPEGG